MRKIILVRHAQSPFKNIKIKDFDRTLNKTGIFEANVMGNQIKKYKVEVDYIITSGANRALETCKIVSKCISYNKKIEKDNNIYNSSIDFMMNLSNNISDEYKTIMIFGHNPTLHHLSQKLSGEIVYTFPTCSMYSIMFDTSSWSEIIKGKKEFMIYPELFK